ncbi:MULTISPECIES: hypothetical protein [Pseudomonas]|uniref:hypothetical protein n=1 Tax=Pseudomonas TaxID=286 RepID=UPI0012DDB7AE|nr:hypothetical protein [Pseudomonas sp. URIL14HWK12:I7]
MPKMLETGMNCLPVLSLSHVSTILKDQSNSTAISSAVDSNHRLAHVHKDDANAGRYEQATNTQAALLTGSSHGHRCLGSNH